jgi:hypothetical protein
MTTTTTAELTTTASDRAEISRRNGARSKGPKTPEGKNRSKFNALKHGMTARTLVLPGEDAEVFQARLDTWTADLRPRNDLERSLVQRAATVSWQLDRLDHVDLARLERIIRAAAVEEPLRQADEAAALGQRLLADARGPASVYPHYSYTFHWPRTSYSGLVDDPDQPARLILRLEATAAGCQWLLDRWAELRALLEKGLGWQSPDKLKASRLLGRQPLDAADEDSVAELFLACHRIEPQYTDPFTELYCELTDDQIKIYQSRLAGRRLERLRPKNEAQARERLLAIVDRAVSRLTILLADRAERAAADAAGQAARLSFDPSTDAERLRRFQLASGRSLLRTLDTFLKIHRADEGPEPDQNGPADPSFDGSDPAGLSGSPPPRDDAGPGQPAHTAPLVETDPVASAGTSTSSSPLPDPPAESRESSIPVPAPSLPLTQRVGRSQEDGRFQVHDLRCALRSLIIWISGILESGILLLDACLRRTRKIGIEHRPYAPFASLGSQNTRNEPRTGPAAERPRPRNQDSGGKSGLPRPTPWAGETRGGYLTGPGEWGRAPWEQAWAAGQRALACGIEASGIRRIGRPSRACDLAGRYRYAEHPPPQPA